MGDQPRLNPADIEAITASFSAALATALNNSNTNLVDQIGTFINGRPRRDRNPAVPNPVAITDQTLAFIPVPNQDLRKKRNHPAMIPTTE